MRSPDRVIPALVAAVFAVSFSAIFVRWSEAHPLVLAAFRLLLSCAFLLPWAAIVRARGRWMLAGRDLWLAAASGCVLGLHYVLWFASLERTSVASSTALVTIHPLFILPYGAVAWGERLRPRGLIGFALALFGGLSIGGGDLALGKEQLVGDLLALSAALAMAAYLLIGGALRRRVDLVSYLSVVYGMGAATALGAALLSGIALFSHPPREWLIFFGLAIVPTMLGHTLFNWSLKYTEPSVVSVSVLGEPIGASLLALAFFGEIPGVWQAVGGAAILAGMYLFITGRSAERRGRTLVAGRGAPA